MSARRPVRAGATASDRRWVEYSPACRPRAHGDGDIRPSGSNFSACDSGLKMRNHGAASGLVPATHCQFSALLARSASTSVSQNQRSPCCQSCSRFFTRNEAVIMRTRLCIQPVLPQLAHAGIHHGEIRCGRAARRAAPRASWRQAHVLEAGVSRPIGQGGVQHQLLRGELAPDQFGAETVAAHGVGRQAGAFARLERRGPHLARRQFAMSQIRRQSRVGVQIRAIAVLRIARKP